MKTIQELYSENIQRVHLDILVFGPNPSTPPVDDHAHALARKRVEIRDSLRGSGHNVKFGEEIIDPHAPPPVSNPYLQERLLLAEYDLIVTLVYTPGSLVESGTIAALPEFAQKTHFFISKGLEDSFPYHACAHARDQWRAKLDVYNYPDDLLSCSLLGFIRTTVSIVQTTKFLSF